MFISLCFCIKFLRLLFPSFRALTSFRWYCLFFSFSCLLLTFLRLTNFGYIVDDLHFFRNMMSNFAFMYFRKIFWYKIVDLWVAASVFRRFLSNLLHILTENEFTVKESFDATNKIQALPSEVFDEGYRFVSFDVTSLFTNIPLNRTIKIILKRLYEDKVIPTKLRKRTMKKINHWLLY